MATVTALFNDLEQISVESRLIAMRIYCPESVGLESASVYLLGSTAISTEGLWDSIKSKFSSFTDKVGQIFDKVIEKINALAAKLGFLSKEQKKQLAMIKAGKLDARKASLPISRDTILTFVKLSGAILVAVGARWARNKLAKSMKKDIQDSLRMATRSGVANPSEIDDAVVRENVKLRNTVEAAEKQMEENQRIVSSKTREGRPATPEELAQAEQYSRMLAKRIGQLKERIVNDAETRAKEARYGIGADEDIRAEGKRISRNIVGKGVAFVALMIAGGAAVIKSITYLARLVGKLYRYVTNRTDKNEE